MFSKQLLERMVRAFIVAATATISVGILGTAGNLPAAKALVVGAIASGISACLSLVATLVGDPESTSFVK